jgi:hypothetical protein
MDNLIRTTGQLDKFIQYVDDDPSGFIKKKKMI